MARTKTTKKAAVARSTRSTRTVAKKEQKSSIADYFRLTESYASLLLGIIVVIIAASLFILFLKNKNITSMINMKKDISATKTVNQEAVDAQMSGSLAKPGSVYTVSSGDDLWKIAVKVYNDGYRWTEIAKLNNITDPGMITVGQKLTLPQGKTDIAVGPTSTPSVTSGNSNGSEAQKTIAGMSYTVVSGDTLWSIAERAYGSGYKWVEIAKGNNLINPNVIHAGNIFKLPR